MKTIEEINEKIKKGKVVVVTAEEMIRIAKREGIKKASKMVDVVTTGTFSPMCSSGAYFNLKPSKPRIKLGGGKCYLNNVPAYCGFAACDIFIGATALPDNDPRNKNFPGRFKYGGAHVIEDLVSGKKIKLRAEAFGTDCYPMKKLEMRLGLKDFRDAVLFNMRNCYQNYNVAVNLSKKTIYTYMGILKPNLANASFCTSGHLSPLLNDPYYQTIGIGTRIFLGGTIGYICWPGTQHSPFRKEGNTKEIQIPSQAGGTIAVIGNLKKMKKGWLKAIGILGYGTSLMVGIGIPIPIVDEEMAKFTSIGDEEIFAPIVDYSKDYPNCSSRILGKISYAKLKSGEIEIFGKRIPTFTFSNYTKAREIAEKLKRLILKGKFLLTRPIAPLPGGKLKV